MVTGCSPGIIGPIRRRARIRCAATAALIDQRQQAGVHQRGFAGARVAVDLQPAHGREAQASVEAGERVQRFLLPAEEQLRLIRTIGGEPDERATLERDGVVGDDVALADVAEQAFGQLIGAVPGRDLEQPQERRKRLRLAPVQQDLGFQKRLCLIERRRGVEPKVEHLRAQDGRHPVVDRR